MSDTLSPPPPSAPAPAEPAHRHHGGPVLTPSGGRARPPRRVSDVAVQRLIEANELSHDADQHLATCTVCHHLAECQEGCPPCAVGGPLLAMARAARALAKAHAEARR